MRKQLFIVIGGAVAFTIILAGLWPEIGLNLFSEAVGVAFTIFVIQWIFDNEEKERTKPARMAALRDAFKVHLACFHLMDEIVKTFAEIGDAPMLKSLKVGEFSPTLVLVLERLTFKRAAPRVHLNLDTGKTTFLLWEELFPHLVNDIRGTCVRFLDRHAFTAPPQLVEIIQKLEDSSLLRMAERYGHMYVAQPTMLQHTWKSFLAESNNLRAQLIISCEQEDLETAKFVIDFQPETLANHVEQHPYAEPATPYRPSR